MDSVDVQMEDDHDNVDLTQHEQATTLEENKEGVQKIENGKAILSKKSDSLNAVTKKLAKCGYCIVKDEEDGFHRFLQTKDNAKFKFVDQKHYDKLGDLLCDWIQALMMDKYKMEKVMVPFDDELTEGRCQAPIFKSHDWEDNTKGALILIQGTGDVRSGYWARSVCMNDTLELGSMIPDIEFAQQHGLACLIMNPNYSQNESKVKVDNKIRGMNHHWNYVWENLVENDAWKAKELFMVAHSAGGGCAHEIIVNHQDTMVEKMKGIALTDAWHGQFYKELKEEAKPWAETHCRAYDASYEALDKPLENRYYKTKFPELSAGHHKHVYTTGCARPSYLGWFVLNSPTLSKISSASLE
jgi:hypothetical protein